MGAVDRFVVSVAVFGLLAGFGLNGASAEDLKCEPAQVATKYPTLATKTIKIGQDGESPPFSFRDPKDFNHLVGLDADLARATFECAGLKVEFVTGSWSGLLPAVIAGQIDVMWDTLFMTRERAKRVDFVSYLSAASGGLVAKGNSKQVRSVDDACGLRATAGLGTVEEAMFRNLSSKCKSAGKNEIEVITYPDLPAGARLIQNGRADLLVSDLAMIDAIVNNNPGTYERAFAIETSDKKAVGLTKGDKDLARAIYDGLTILKANGTAKAILAKYGVDYGLFVTPEIVTE